MYSSNWILYFSPFQSLLFIPYHMPSLLSVRRKLSSSNIASIFAAETVDHLLFLFCFFKSTY